MPSELNWSLAYSFMGKDATADEIEEMAKAFARLGCHSCAHADVCTRSTGPEDICHEYMLVSDCEKIAA